MNTTAARSDWSVDPSLWRCAQDSTSTAGWWNSLECSHRTLGANDGLRHCHTHPKTPLPAVIPSGDGGDAAIGHCHQRPSAGCRRVPRHHPRQSLAGHRWPCRRPWRLHASDGGVAACVCLPVDVAGSPDRLSPAHHAQRGADHRRTLLALLGGCPVPLASLKSRAYW